VTREDTSGTELRLTVEVALTLDLVPEDLGPDDVAVVIDVVRASTTVAFALQAGAEGVLPVADEDGARAAAAARGALLAGERGGHAPPGFDLGNSPRQMTADAVAGRELVLTTTNGTLALARCAGAGVLLTGALVNAEATARAAAARARGRVLLVCAGSRRRLAADDVAAAGCLVGNLALLAAAEPSDGARVAAALFDTWRHDLLGLLRRSRSGRHVIEQGLEDDLPLCARVDTLPLAVGLDASGVLRKL